MKMKNYGSWLLLFAITIALSLFPAATVGAQHHGSGSQHHGGTGQHHADANQHHGGTAQHHEQALKVGKRGEMMLDTETRVGELTLQPGRYTLQHRVEGSDHFVRFLRVSTPSGGTPQDSPEEIRCRLEPMDAKAQGTKIYKTAEGGVVRVSKIIVGGENVAHVF